MTTMLIFILGVETPLSIIGLIALKKLFEKGKEVVIEETIEENCLKAPRASEKIGGSGLLQFFPLL